MRTFTRILVVFLAFISLASFKKQQQVDEWVYEREKKGIKVFTKKGKWGNLRDSKAVMVVSGSPQTIYNFLTDFSNYNTWYPRCSKSRVLAKLSENEMIVQLYFDAPWPVKDRDCILRIKTVRDAKTGTITMYQTSEPKYTREESDVVRIQQIQAVWKLTPKNGGTEIINEYASNPGGNIPDWMTNTQSVENPLVTFENIQEKTTGKK
ncbi:MAG TPA: START domain-containing protein [Chitinophagales bacterium]|nr:START domain-containing protein [Chitinophagales bacterium]